MKKVVSIVLLLICGGIFLTAAIGSSSNASTSSDSGGTQSTTSELTTYKINEDIYITNNTGKYRVKFISVTETSDRNQFSDKRADRVVIIEWEYENISCAEDLYISDMLNFKLYDKDNNKLETYPAGSTKYGGSVGQGRKAVSSEAFALNNSNNYIELEFYDNTWNSKPDCKVILEW